MKTVATPEKGKSRNEKKKILTYNISQFKKDIKHHTGQISKP